MLITSNIEENQHTPSLGFTFKRDRKSLSLRGTLNYRKRNKREYISLDDSKRSIMDDIYISNLTIDNPADNFILAHRIVDHRCIYAKIVVWASINRAT